MQAVVSLEQVLSRPDVWRGNRLASTAIPPVSSGFAALDAELAGGGWPRGALTEILSDAQGAGECSLLLPALLAIQKEGKAALLVAPPHRVHGPAWSSAGVDLTRLIVVAPRQQRDVLWVTEQGLASGALGMILSWIARAEERQMRRLQVAVSGSGALAFMFRPSRVENVASAAILRLSLKASPHGLNVRLLKRRGPPCHQTLCLDITRPIQRRNEHEPSVARAAFSCAIPRRQRPILLA